MRYLMVLIFVLIFAGTSEAHRVNVYAYAEGGRVYGEAYFVDGTRARNAEFQVYRRDNGQLLLRGRTDEKGQFSFPIPGPYALRIVLRASMGHQSEYVIEKEEVLEAQGLKEQSPVQEVASEGVVEVTGPEKEDIDSVLERHLRPLREEMVKLRQAQERPSFRDILSGLGYIMGLVGVYLYMRSRMR